MDEFLRLEIKYMFVTSYPQLCGFHMQLHSTFGHHYERDNLKSFVPEKKKKKKVIVLSEPRKWRYPIKDKISMRICRCIHITTYGVDVLCS